MDHKQDSRLEKLLHGRAEGAALALRGCTQEQAEALKEAFGADAPRPLRFLEPCRTEHPHSAFLRKTMSKDNASIMQTTLYAPGGRLSEERGPDGAALEHFVKKPHDFETLRGHLRDVELHPAKAIIPVPGAASIALLGLTPTRELETRWAGNELTSWALTAQDESAASCLRKLERHLHRKAEEALKAGCRACVLTDMAVRPLPESYLPAAARHLEWLRHAGLPAYVEITEPAGPLLTALHDAGAGARLALSLALEAADALPEGMRLLLDVSLNDSDAHAREPLTAMLRACASAVFVLDCHDEQSGALLRTAGLLLEALAKAAPKT